MSGEGNAHSILKHNEIEFDSLYLANNTLMQEQKSLLSLFDKSNSALIKVKNDVTFSFEYVSPSIEVILGYKQDDFLNNQITNEQLIHKDDYPKILQEVQDALKNNNDFFTLKPYRVITKSGRIKWLLNHATTQRDENGEVSHFIISISDITSIKQAELKLQNFANIIDEYVISTSTDLDGNIISVSKAYEKMYGYSKKELLGKPHSLVRHEDMPDEIFASLWQTITKNEIWKGEIKSKTKSGGYQWASVVIVPDFDSDGKKIGYTAIRENITAQKALEEISIRDELTRLYNRRYFNSVFEQEINRYKRGETPFFFLMLDLDYFKRYNDTYGHQDGDGVLIKIGEIINSFTKRAGDYGFRLGGEEFGILAQYEKQAEALAFAQQIREAVESLKITNSPGYITVSIGVFFKALSIQDTSRQIYKACDDALYEAKKRGRNRVVLFDSL